MSHSEEYKKNLTDIADVLERYSKAFERLASVTPDEELKTIYRNITYTELLPW